MKKTTADNFYKSIQCMYLIDTCVGCSIGQWEKYMDNTVKADYRKVHRLIKSLCPEFIDLTVNNPYRYQYKRKSNLIVVVHSATEYFFKVG